MILKHIQIATRRWIAVASVVGALAAPLPVWSQAMPLPQAAHHPATAPSDLSLAEQVKQLKAKIVDLELQLQDQQVRVRSEAAGGAQAARGVGESSTAPNPPTAAARLAASESVCQLLHDKATGVPQVYQDVEHSYVWSKRRMEAQRDVDAGRGDRFSALEAHLQRMRDLQARIAQLYKTGAATEFDLASTQFYVAEGEELLARERTK